jgi:hypothetical protein
MTIQSRKKATQRSEIMKNNKRSWVIRCLTVFCLAGQLAACNTLPMEEYAEFAPQPANKRIMNQVKISWEVREDVADFCAKQKGMSKDAAFLSPPLACAIWNVPRKECTVVTGSKTTHLALGHEIRHCFEGHFH